MKEKIKNVVVIIVMLIVAFFITGCSDKKIEPRYGILEEAVYRDLDSVSFTDILNESGITVKEANEESKEIVSSLENELVEYINNEYNLEWKESGVSVYELDFSKVDGYSIYNAMADPENNSFFLNTSVYSELDTLDTNVQIIAVHELIHCLTYENVGTYKFVLTDSEGGKLGYYNSEAFTDFLTIKFFESKGMPEVKEFLYTNSGYCYTTCCLIMLESAIPNEIYYYLTNDIESLEKEFNDLASKYMIIPENTENNAFEAFLYRTDLNQAITIMFTQGYYSQELTDNWIQSVFGNFEEVVILSRGQSRKSQKESFEECYNLFELEGDITGELEEFLEYLNSCIR